MQLLYEEQNPKLIEFVGNREAILKARQLGFSTYIAAKMFCNTINTPNTQSIIIAQDEDNSKRIFQIIRRFYENLLPQHKRIAKNESTTAYYWADIDSMFFVGWAGSRKLGRGGTANNVHCSEPAFWENAEDLVLGLFNSVPDDGNIFLESTANGVDNYFYREYMAATRQESAYTPRFYPWFIDELYRAKQLTLGGEFVPTEEELKYADLYDLDFEQLMWKRNRELQLRNAFLSGDGQSKSFKQEYPSNAKEAFLVSGVSYFDREFITEECYPKVLPPLGTEAPFKYATLGLIKKQQTGRIEYWQQPQQGHRYLITADPSEGMNLNDELDYCSSDVIDMDTFEQVCTVHGRWEPHEYAHILSELGTWYNKGLIVVLRMNHGHSVLNTLINVIGYEGLESWGGIYFHQEYDKKTKKKNQKPGLPENQMTNIMILSALQKLFHDGSLKVSSEKTLDEMMMFTKLPGNKYGASVGYDDRVKSLAAGAFIIDDPQFHKQQLKKQNKPKPIMSSPLKGTGRML